MQDFPAAQYALGICYQNGWGIEKNESETLKYITKSIELVLNMKEEYFLKNYKLFNHQSNVLGDILRGIVARIKSEQLLTLIQLQKEKF